MHEATRRHHGRSVARSVARSVLTTSYSSRSRVLAGTTATAPFATQCTVHDASRSRGKSSSIGTPLVSKGSLAGGEVDGKSSAVRVSFWLCYLSWSISSPLLCQKKVNLLVDPQSSSPSTPAAWRGVARRGEHVPVASTG